MLGSIINESEHLDFNEGSQMFNIDKITKIIAALSATFALVGSSYTFIDKVGMLNKREQTILTWAPEYFSVSSGKSDEEFTVIAAREKHRDDCVVEDFLLQVRDSRFIMHLAVPSITKFSGPSTNKIDKFGFTFTIKSPEKVVAGQAQLVAQIEYKCNDGIHAVDYPDHENLRFNISK